MNLVPRRARNLVDPQSRTLEDLEAEDLQAFRSLSAWVLLGEPGAGKSTVLEQEAEAIGGVFLRIGQFIHADIEPEWRGKTLFLDGLDEVRASGGTDSSVIELVCRQIKRLGNPSFRIACRAADWYGSIDRDDLKAVSPDRQISVLLLQPLSHQDILGILRDNYEVEDPQGFIETAKKRQVDGLLDNPQTLGLLAGAVNKGNEWPETRADTYRLACEKLAQEENPRNRHQKRNRIKSVEQLLNAAGQISAVLLLSDKTGLAQDKYAADGDFPELEVLSPPDYETACQVLDTKLFRPEGEQRAVPSHRSIAEYLAARWLAQRINDCLPLGRVLNLLLGRDGRAVAGLRGLYAWLALHSQTAKSRLIESDPLTVVIYGDVKPVSLENKRQILAGLRREAEAFAGFRIDTPTTHPFGALAEVGLIEDFRAILHNPERDEASQAHVDCVLDILSEGEAFPELASEMLKLVKDESRWARVRYSALQVWLKLEANLQAKLSLLDDIAKGLVADNEDELTGILLQTLYPDQLKPDELLRYLYFPTKGKSFLTYAGFWISKLSHVAPDSHVPVLLDGLAEKPELRSDEYFVEGFNKMANSLLVKGLGVFGDNISDEKLYKWLGIGFKERGVIFEEGKKYQLITDWLSHRPERYKSVLALCFKYAEQDMNPIRFFHKQQNRLHNAAPPDDIGLWHLEQVSLTAHEELAKLHLSEAVNTINFQKVNSGLSLETLEAWGVAHPGKKQWLEPLLAWEIPEWIFNRTNNKMKREQQLAENRRLRSIGIARQLQKVRTGTARVDLLYELAAVWERRFSDINGETIAQRFDNFCENGPEVFEAAEMGFRLCPERDDLPTVDEIIKLSTNQKQHYLALPCLLGMDLRWQLGSSEVDALPEYALRRMIAFRVTDFSGNTPQWFSYLAQTRPEVVAEIFVLYTSQTFKAGRDVLNDILSNDKNSWYLLIARIAVPQILDAFPVRASVNQLRYLARFLNIALENFQECLKNLIEKKTRLKGMDKPQKVYWLATATLLNPQENETKLWHYIGKSESLVSHLAEFMTGNLTALQPVSSISEKMLGKLIEKLSPHAEMNWNLGVSDHTAAMDRGDKVRGFISRLANLATEEAAQELDRMLGLPHLKKLKFLLENARHELRLKQRESEFRFLSPKEVAQVLANREPASAADLAMLVLDHLDTIAMEIRQGNDDGFRAFWTETDPNMPKKENSCRDVLLTRLRLRLNPLKVDCQPEGDYFNDKRADLRLSYGSELELPIEIKRDTNDKLWTALRNQLINQYAEKSPRAYGYGIYLVFWFGEKGIPGAKDGGKNPTSPEELQARLEAQLDPVEKQSIFVRVIDVSWPKSNKTIIPAI